MKKLLIFMLVLGMASVSQAVMIDLTVGGLTEYLGTSGETITVDVIADLRCTAFGIGAVAETDAARSQILIGAAGGSVGSAVLTGGPGVTITAGGWQNNYNGLLFDLAAGYGDSVAGVVIASFDYTIASDWDGTTGYYVAPLPDGTSYEWAEGSFEIASFSYGTLDVEGTPTNIEIGGLHIIPEPMTVLLLGLGGLFLRRRKG